MRYFIASKWRNKEAVEELTHKLRKKGAAVFNFFEKENNLNMTGGNPEQEMQAFEAIKNWQGDERIQSIFESDITELKRSDALTLLLPAGNSAHIEAGIAYGLCKKLIVIGNIKKAETHYLIFDEFYDSIDEFIASL